MTVGSSAAQAWFAHEPSGVSAWATAHQLRLQSGMRRYAALAVALTGEDYIEFQSRWRWAMPMAAAVSLSLMSGHNAVCTCRYPRASHAHFHWPHWHWPLPNVLCIMDLIGYSHGNWHVLPYFARFYK